MPAVYAHHRFGDKALQACPSPLAREVVTAFPDLYAIGLQGPDVLFYYDPLRPNPCKAAGNALHDAPAAPFFVRGLGKVDGSPLGRALLSYLLGMTCHFALDSACHSYIEHRIQCTGQSHVSIETALEGRLMAQDGVDWRTVNPAGYLAAHETACRTMARVLPASPARLRRCLVNMKLFNGLLMPGRPLINGLAEQALRRSGKWEEIGGLLFSALDPEEYAQSSSVLTDLFFQAVPKAAALMDSCCAHVQSGAPLDPRFDKTYGPDPEAMALFAAKPAD